jgi:hypothetical protein
MKIGRRRRRESIVRQVLRPAEPPVVRHILVDELSVPVMNDALSFCTCGVSLNIAYC